MDEFEIVYEVEGKRFINSSSDCLVKCQKESDRLIISIYPKKPLKLISARVDLGEKMGLKDKFFSNGYQSWTDSQEQSFFQRTKKMGFLGRKTNGKYHFSAYGDYDFIEYHPHYSFSFTYLRKNDDFRFFGSMSEKEGYTVFYISKGRVWAYKDAQGIIIDKDEKIFDIFLARGQGSQVFEDYALNFYKKSAPKEKLKGFTTWYRHYQDINEANVIEDLKLIPSQCGFKYFQIDDGYEPAIGDWLVPDQKKFPQGFAPVMKKIQEKGLKAGIWLAPFVVGLDSAVYKEHPSWVLKDEQGKPIIHGSNWNGAYVLDIYNPEVKEHLHDVFTALKKEGFTLFKLDFLYAVSLGQREDKTRGEVMCEAMEFLRKELDGCLILGCGVPLFPAFFNVDYCRIGMDVSLKFDDVWYMKFCHRERISSKLGLKNTYYRRFLDGIFFRNDPDVILLKGTQMSQKQKERLYQTAKAYGSVFFTSDDFSLYGEDDMKKWEDLK